jgi:hypothetical protein
MMATTFTKLNQGWNAEPNGHHPHISIEGTDLVFEFLLNDLLYPEYKKAEKGILRFRDCWRYRLGQTNSEGWYRGQCRFSRFAPEWGEFYEVHGDLLLDATPNREAFYDVQRKMQLKPDSLDWVTIGKPRGSSRHFLFYLRDQTFECDASVWEFSVKWRT